MKKLLLLLLFFPFYGWALNITNVTSITSSAALYEKYEIGVALDQVFSNPYNLADINVYAIFEDPAGILPPIRINGFYYQPFFRDPGSDVALNDINGSDPNSLIPQSTSYPWRIRFAPPKTGNWHYKVYATTPQGTTISPYYDFFVSKSANEGYIKVAPNNKNFTFSDGNIFIPIGFNHTTEVKSVTEYNRMPYFLANHLITDMGPYGGDFLRVIMNPENFNMEWETLGNYDSRQKQAFDMDAIVDLAGQNNVYLQICLEVQGELIKIPWNNTDLSFWPSNPYNSLVASPDDFFTDNNCQLNYQNKLAYMIARWGYSTHLFGYEMFNEIDQYGDYWADYHWEKIKDWHKTMIDYAKSLDKNHMFTTSATSAQSGYYNYPPDHNEALYDIPQLDYLQEHGYDPDFNIEYQRNFINHLDVITEKKPSFYGEIGFSPYTVYTSSFISSSSFPLFFGIEYHNSVWASAFMGSGGTDIQWASVTDMVGTNSNNNNGDGYYKTLQPLSDFLNGESDFFNSPYKPIANPCEGSGPDDNQCNIGNDPDFPDNENTHCVPVWSVNLNHPQVNSSFLTQGINTSDDRNIEVFALQGDNKIIGWIHDKQNYWYNLPYGGSTSYTFNCSASNATIPLQNAPTTYPGWVTTISGAKATIHNLCKGSYKIEFYNTYPSVAGITPSQTVLSNFTQSLVYVGCDGDLTFTIPTMQALHDLIPGYKGAEYEPDYGFKITKLLDIWSNHILTSDNSEIVGSGDNLNKVVSAASDNEVFYVGQDNKIHHVYPTVNNTWSSEIISTNPNYWSLGNICVSLDANNVFYQALYNPNIGHLYKSGTDWYSESVSGLDNSGPLVTNNDGSELFTVGTDYKVHYYNHTNNAWQDQSSYFGGFPDAGGDIALANNGNDIYYAGTDNKIYHCSYNGSWNIEMLWGGGNTSIAGSLSVDALGQNLVYRGTDGNLQYYYNNGTGWQHDWFEWLDGNNNINYETVTGQCAISQDGTHIFFEGFDGYIHQRYYLGGTGPTYNTWAGDYLICYNELSDDKLCNKYLSCINNDRVFYKGAADNQLHAFLFNSGCEETHTYNKPAKNTQHYSDPVLNSQYFNTTANTHYSDDIDKFVDVVAYPNPCKDELSIKFSEMGNYNLQITNSIGSITMQQNVSDKSVTINMQNYINGVYFLKVSDINGREIKVLKIVKL